MANVNKTKLKAGDNVYILTGKDKGKTGKIEKIYKEKQLVLVENVNMVKKHVKPNPNRGVLGPGFDLIYCLFCL